MPRRGQSKRKRRWVQAISYGFTLELLLILDKKCVPYLSTKDVLSSIVFIAVGLAIVFAVDSLVKYLVRFPGYVLTIIFTVWFVGMAALYESI